MQVKSPFHVARLAWLSQELSKGILAWRHQEYKGSKKTMNKRPKKREKEREREPGRVVFKTTLELDAGKRSEVFCSVPVQHLAQHNPKLQLSSLLLLLCKSKEAAAEYGKQARSQVCKGI